MKAIVFLLVLFEFIKTEELTITSKIAQLNMMITILESISAVSKQYVIPEQRKAYFFYSCFFPFLADFLLIMLKL